MTAAVLTATIAVGFFAHAPAAWSCSCVQRTIEQHVEAADFVFHGRVRVESVTAHERRATIVLDEIFKGRLPATLNVSTGADSAGCGVNFVRGSRYTIFAVQEGQQLTTSACSGTTDDPAVRITLQALIASADPSASIEPVVTVASDDGPATGDSRTLPIVLASILLLAVGGAVSWRRLVG